MKLLLKSIFLSFFSLGAFSQDWNVVEQNEQYSIYVAEIEHKDERNGLHHQRLIFRYQNHTSNPLEIRFNREVKYGEITSRDEQNFVVVIPEKGIVEYDKSKANDKTYYLFKKDHENFIKRSLEDYKIVNLRLN